MYIPFHIVARSNSAGHLMIGGFVAYWQTRRDGEARRRFRADPQRQGGV